MSARTKAKKSVKAKAVKSAKAPLSKKAIVKTLSKVSTQAQKRSSKAIAYLGTAKGKRTAAKTAIGVAAVAAAGVGIVYATRYIKRRMALRVPDVQTKEGSPNEPSPLKNLPETSPSRKIFESAKTRGSNERRRNALKQANRHADTGSLKANTRSSYSRTSHS